jgi:glycosyltransferase involved in cell wall biosynthesis
MDELFPKLTIIVPTLNRADTVGFTLETVLNQTYKNFQIIVSDNCSNDNTKEVIDSFKSNKITYTKPPERLSMSHHWEYVLQFVDSGYVTILGDDDGLVPNSLEKIAHLIRKHKLDAIGWQFANFNWEGLPVFFKVPLSNTYSIVDSKKEIKRLLNLNTYQLLNLPSLYGGFINIKLIKRIKEQNNNTFFHSRIPDFYSAAVISANISKYIRCDFPISINATSKHSTGYSAINKESNQTAFESLQMASNNIDFHSSLVFIRSNTVPITEALLQVNKLYPYFPMPNIAKLVKEVLAESTRCATKEQMEELVEGARKIAVINKLDLNSFNWQQVHSPSVAVYKEKFSPISLLLYINSKQKKVSNVLLASQFTTKILRKKIHNANTNFVKLYYRIITILYGIYVKTKL